MYDLLKGVRVIEGASFVAAPYCGLCLAQLGAEVIRFDAIGGGPDFKRWPLALDGSSFYWEGLNKSKKSIAINLKSPHGRELAVALITAEARGAGIFITNYPAEGFLSHNRLSKERADLISARVMGHADGSSAVDYTINCAVGLPMMTGSAKHPDEPVNHVLPAWDLLTGSMAATSVLAALQHRSSTGSGQEIRVPLSDVAAATLGTLGQIAEVGATGNDRKKIGNDLFGAFGRDFLTADGDRVMVVALTDRQWASLTGSLSLEREIADAEASLGVSFSEDEGIRYVFRDHLNDLFARAISGKSTSELEALFNAHDVCWGRYRTLRDALVCEPMFSSSNPLFSKVIHPSGHAYLTPGFPATFNDLKREAATRAPRLGEHTDEVLSNVLSLPSHAIGDLHDRGIVQSAGENL